MGYKIIYKGKGATSPSDAPNAAQSNKPHILPNPSSKQGKSAGPTALAPIIDKLTVTLTAPDMLFAHDMFTALHQTLKSPFLISADHSSGYHRAVRLRLGADEEEEKEDDDEQEDGDEGEKEKTQRELRELAFPLFEVHYSNNVIDRVRIDFVPVDLGYEGMMDLHLALVPLVPGGWLSFIEHGRITRIDIAVDFPDARMDDLLFLPNKSQTTKEWASNGSLETFQIGKAKYTHTMIYDRHAKGETDIPCVRVERRLKRQTLPLQFLATLACPFSALALVKAVVPRPSKEPNQGHWRMFLDAVEHRGLAAALALVSKSKRTLYREHYKAHLADLWDIEDFWLGWQPMLGDLQIVNKQKWV